MLNSLVDGEVCKSVEVVLAIYEHPEKLDAVGVNGVEVGEFIGEFREIRLVSPGRYSCEYGRREQSQEGRLTGTWGRFDGQEAIPASIFLQHVEDRQAEQAEKLVI